MATSEFANGNQDNFYSRKFRSIQSGDAVPYRCYCPIAPIKYSGHKPMMSLECIDVKPYSRHMAPAVSYPRFLDQRTERLSTGMSSYSKLVSPFPRHDMDQLKAPTLQQLEGRSRILSPGSRFVPMTRGREMVRPQTAPALGRRQLHLAVPDDVIGAEFDHSTHVRRYFTSNQMHLVSGWP
ncbi:hypothetical protein GUITHDRAFT_156005 [Guillardia theta CCMP2712]|uniref:Uncharacterized protein n=2 Tax=Guillardia theta TaxID=55529 RepID=L1ICF8_GUITC|nr:hypothetical protein GUITHDRAFT_156005 [Guillardia theta CCMP2712]EKX33525.1 hypothetical protein GUITHDRAFT_156005 [Guillardia theta CCMP2712]|mmetsp:Transcript_43239/g.136714  ORF Transcript_43239/g.136714 Transcript_43239/m.136714 type:complete len:181 (+) Transcript_43239:111-653(+)|eukprot:XP_005820505.1 hypothetical protein GUITHDRAFT_156005 [Guillardia theta CCMP2712]